MQLIQLDPLLDFKTTTKVQEGQVRDYFDLSWHRAIISAAIAVFVYILMNHFGFEVAYSRLWILWEIFTCGVTLLIYRNFSLNQYLGNSSKWSKWIILFSIFESVPWILLPWVFLNNPSTETLLFVTLATLVVCSGVFFVPSNFKSSAICIVLIFSSFSFRCLSLSDELGFYSSMLVLGAGVIILLSLNGLHRSFLKRVEVEVMNHQLVEQARKANEAKSNFLSTASHDLRQPVHSLSILLEIMAEKYSKNDSKLIGLMNTSLLSMKTMLSSLLDLSKLDAGVLEPHLQDVNLLSLVNRLVDEFDVQLGEKGNRIEVDIDDFSLHTDIGMLESILRNLISNANRYCVDEVIVVHGLALTEVYKLSIIDNGCGIPKEHQDKIFQEFFQVGNPQRDHQHGLGLGLTIVKKLCDLLQYGIELESNQNGTTFALQMPVGLISEKRDIVKGLASQNPIGLSGSYVLLIDDNSVSLESLTLLLKTWNAEVYPAADAEEAWDLAINHHVDLVISDYRLPGKRNGVEFVQDLREKCLISIPAMIITGDTDKYSLEKIQESGFQLIHKPVDADVFGEMILSMMEQD